MAESRAESLQAIVMACQRNLQQTENESAQRLKEAIDRIGELTEQQVSGLDEDLPQFPAGRSPCSFFVLFRPFFI